ncbi:UNVERIFIED_CONTAM: hypothetical protein H355_004875 [Colinus virginianus]|nr:hypothetical protein H355_004875 [Colinus virginianus]
MRHDYKPWKVQRPEPSCKPKSEYQPSDTPFEKETQYQKDFRAWPIPKRGDHPWIPKPGPSPVLGPERGSPEKAAQEKRRKKEEEAAEADEEHPKAARPGDGREKGRQRGEEAGGQEGRGRAAADALNRQIKEEVVAAGVSSSYRNEFRPWIDVKPVKAIKAKAQYKPPEEKMTHETSYSAQFKGETSKPAPADNKFLERRRIRTLYSEPYKEPPKLLTHHVTLYPRNDLARARSSSAVNTENFTDSDIKPFGLWARVGSMDPSTCEYSRAQLKPGVFIEDKGDLQLDFGVDTEQAKKERGSPS